MAATAYEAGRRLIELGLRRVADIPAGKPSLEEGLAILRDVTAHPTNTVLYELAVAARTDAKLRDTMRDVMAVYMAKIFETVRAMLPDEAEAVGEENSMAMFALALSSFNGTAMFQHVLNQPDAEKGQIPLLISLLGAPVTIM
jgi:hypothetical protein